MRGIVKTLLAESLSTKDEQERGCVVLILEPLSEVEHLVPTARLGVQLSEGNCRMRRRFELLDDIDRSVHVTTACLSSASAKPSASRLMGNSAVTPCASESSRRVAR